MIVIFDCQRGAGERLQLVSQGQSLARTQKALSEALGSLNSSVATVTDSLASLSKALVE
jgi:hypothetical protein